MTQRETSSHGCWRRAVEGWQRTKPRVRECAVRWRSVDTGVRVNPALAAFGVAATPVAAAQMPAPSPAVPASLPAASAPLALLLGASHLGSPMCSRLPRGRRLRMCRMCRRVRTRGGVTVRLSGSRTCETADSRIMSTEWCVRQRFTVRMSTETPVPGCDCCAYAEGFSS